MLFCAVVGKSGPSFLIGNAGICRQRGGKDIGMKALLNHG